MTSTRRGRFLASSAVFLFFATLAVGCNPAMIAMLARPFVDDNVPAKFKLAIRDKEVNVAIVCSFANPDIHPELLPSDGELAEKLAVAIRHRSKENKEKVKVVPTPKVRAAQSRLAANGPVDPVELGKNLKADYVITLEIASLSLYKKRSNNMLFQGGGEINVSVYDVNHKEDAEAKAWEDVYRVEYPNNRPVDATGTSAAQFRSVFLSKVAADLSRCFCAYPRELQHQID